MDNNKTILLTFINLLLVGGVVAGANVGTALFLKQYGVQYLPHAFFIIAVITILLNKILNITQKTISPKKLLLFSVIINFILITICWFLLRVNINSLNKIITFIIYIIPELSAFSLFSQFWNISSNHYQHNTVRKIFPLIAAGGSIGGAVSGASISFLSNVVGIHHLLLLWSFELLLLIPLIIFLQSKFKPDIEWSPHSNSEKKNLIGPSKNKFFVFLFLSVMLGTILSCTLEYQSSKLFNDYFLTADSLASFLGALSGIGFLLSLLLQGIFLSKIIHKIGLSNTIIIFPLLTLISSLLLCLNAALMIALFGTILIPAIFGYSTRRYFKGSFFTVVNDLILNVFVPEQKSKIRIFIKGTVNSCSIIIGNIIIYFSQYLYGYSGVAAAGLFSAVLYVAVGIFLIKNYRIFLVK